MITLTLTQILNNTKETTPATVYTARHFTYDAEGVILTVVLSGLTEGYRYDNHTLNTCKSFTVKTLQAYKNLAFFARNKSSLPLHQACQIIKHLLNNRVY